MTSIDKHFFSQPQVSQMLSRSRKRIYAPKRKATSRSATPWRGKTARRSYTGPTKAIVSAGVGLGQSARTVLKTVFFQNLTSDASGIVRAVLYPGSCFEVGSAVPTQPTLFDQWAATYGRYVVEKAFIKLEVSTAGLNVGGVNTATLAAAYPATQYTLGTGGIPQFAGQANAQSVLLGPTDVTSSNTMTFRLDHAKVLGRKGIVTSEDNGALVTANPTPGQFMILPYCLQNSTAAVYAWVVRVTLYQTVWFDRRKTVVDA